VVSAGHGTGFEQAVLDAMPDPVLVLAADGTIVQANRAVEYVTGWRPGQLVSRNVAELLHPDDLGAMTQACSYALADGAPLPCEIRLRAPDGRWCTLEIMGNNLLDTDIEGVVVSARDLGLRPRYDELTGLANHRLIEQRLADAIDGRGRAGVVLVDLDAFTTVNDLHGRAAGDRVLQVMAERLQASVRGVDIVGRRNDDEFVLVCSGLSGADGLAWIARRIVATVPEPIVLPDGTQLRPTASVGAAMQSPRLNTADALLRAADSAVYEVKRAGRDGWHLYAEPEEERPTPPVAPSESSETFD
jgi:diguanylate cyclase (GGDEF)-like protein/PAS domain S-box-containing protein